MSGHDAPDYDADGGLRGTVADAADFARECAEEWRVERVTVRVDERRDTLPPNLGRPDRDGPTWIIRPVRPAEQGGA